MKNVCDFCAYQRHASKGEGVECGRAVYHTDREGYGTFKHGALCKHDSDLADHFTPRTGAEIDVRNMAGTIDNLRDENTKQRERIRQLESRLLRVDA